MYVRDFPLTSRSYSLFILQEEDTTSRKEKMIKIFRRKEFLIFMMPE